MSSSILTNVGAMTALQTLTSINHSLETTQDRISTGMRVGSAKDNAAYWAIATTMRTDLVGYQAISDAIGLGQSTADVASTANEAIVDLLKEMKQRLVAAQDAGVDKIKINDDIQQLKSQIESVISSASFNGNNWLDGSINDTADTGEAVNILASLVRTGSTVTPENIVFDPGQTDYMDANGTGFFQGTLSAGTSAVIADGILGAAFAVDNSLDATDLADALGEVEAAIAKATEVGSLLGSGGKPSGHSEGLRHQTCRRDRAWHRCAGRCGYEPRKCPLEGSAGAAAARHSGAADRQWRSAEHPVAVPLISPEKVVRPWPRHRRLARFSKRAFFFEKSEKNQKSISTSIFFPYQRSAVFSTRSR
jgi:flagellin